MGKDFDPESFLEAYAGKKLTRDEWFALSRYAAACEGGAIVEIGSFRGKSAVALAYGVSQAPPDRQSPIFCVDPHETFTGVYGGQVGPLDRGAFYRNMLDTGFSDRVALINLKSTEAAPGWSRPIGLLFVDGDHREAAVRADVAAWEPHVRMGGIIAFDDAKDPAVGPAKLVEEMTAGDRFEIVEEVGKVVFLRKTARSGSPGADDEGPGADLALRQAAVSDIPHLKAGDDHYRAYVGGPDRYDFAGASQFALLFAVGLRDHHRVLDFGCGSLRLGRLLMPFLQEGRYFAVEPNSWLIEDALDREIGRDIVRVKKPTFSANKDFDCASLGSTFDFIIAQSIVTHCGPALFRRVMASFASVLEPDGLLLFSYFRARPGDPEWPSEGWIYPGAARYTVPQIMGFLQEAGFSGVGLDWYHPSARWMLAARSPERLPTEADRRLLNGAVLFDAQFAGSRLPRAE